MIAVAPQYLQPELRQLLGTSSSKWADTQGNEALLQIVVDKVVFTSNINRFTNASSQCTFECSLLILRATFYAFRFSVLRVSAQISKTALPWNCNLSKTLRQLSNAVDPLSRKFYIVICNVDALEQEIKNLTSAISGSLCSALLSYLNVVLRSDVTLKLFYFCAHLSVLL